MLDAGVDRGKAHEIAEGIKLNYRNWIGSLGCKDAHKGMSSLAEKLALGLMNVHLPSDELGRRILQKGADELGPEGTVDQLMNRYAAYPEIKAGPEEVELVCGDPNSPIGRTAVIHAAGTNGGYPVANALFEAGVRTVVYIHLFSDQEAKRLKNESRGNLIVTGHYGSDSLGINPLIDELERRGVEVHCRNRMVRVRRDDRTTPCTWP